MNARIDGRDIGFEDGQTILEAARKNGCFIPTLCELADIGHAPGTCRVCLVEIRKDEEAPPVIVTSCNTPMQEGLVVRTRTPELRRMRRLQVELLLADHDQDCAACVRHGDCELQDLARVVGLPQDRPVLPNPGGGRTRSQGPAVSRDMGKCLRCLRCLAVCRNIQGVDALVVAGEGLTCEIHLRDGENRSEPGCVSCGQCTLVCPAGALAETSGLERAVEMLEDPDTVVVAQFAPAVRVGLGEEFGFAPGSNVEGRIISALRGLGADLVLDTNFAADLVIMEEGSELLARLEQGGPLPLFTSCCPAWINFAETRYPELLPNVSTTRSPQQCLGALAKTYLARNMGLDPGRVRVLSIMPCTAKKDEAARPALRTGGVPDVDLVLTTREFAELLRIRGMDLNAMEESGFADPLMGAYSGAGAIFGTTGGVMEAAVRTVHYLLTGSELAGIELAAVRGYGNVREAELDLGPKAGRIKVAIAHGLKAAARLAEDVLAGRSDHQFIEVMACPGGCMDGGGQPRSKRAYQPHAQARRQALFSIDRASGLRQSHKNPQVQKLYAEFLERPNSQLAHELLHTGYTDRRQQRHYSMKDIWRELSLGARVHGVPE
jgi:ferredoxin hydrogenase gamma subunit